MSHSIRILRLLKRPSKILNYLLRRYAAELIGILIEGSPLGKITTQLIPIKEFASKNKTIVDDYWGTHTVKSEKFQSSFASKEYLSWRFKEYPLMQRLLGLYGNHGGEVVLDYGCGPGNDLVGFCLYSRAKKIIGIDISQKALKLAQHRLNLHRIGPSRVELIHIDDSAVRLPIADRSIDYIYSEGVLHHLSHPLAMLKEFHRVLKPSGSATFMVYNYQSIWLHLYVAYQKQILEQKYAKLNIRKAFSKTTDGENCPISIPYRSEEFIRLGQKAGFKVNFIGGYFSDLELPLLKAAYRKALNHPKLSKEHKDFLRKLEFDQNNLPKYDGKYAGVGGVYRFYKKPPDGKKSVKLKV